MKYYPRNIGDQAALGRHLTLTELGAFVALQDLYYGREQPLVDDLAELQRRAGARTEEDRQAVAAVLRDFFELGPDGHWHLEHADADIAAFQARVEKGQAGARARWEQADLVGDLSTDGPGNANQEPETITQKSAAARRTVNKSKKAKAAAAPAATAEAASTVCDLLRGVGVHDVDVADPLLHELLAVGAPVQEFVAAALRAGHADHPYRYTLKAVQGRMTAQAQGADACQRNLLELDGNTVTDAGATAFARTQQYLRSQELTPEERAAAQEAARRLRQERLQPRGRINSEPAHA